MNLLKKAVSKFGLITSKFQFRDPKDCREKLGNFFLRWSEMEHGVIMPGIFELVSNYYY